VDPLLISARVLAEGIGVLEAVVGVRKPARIGGIHKLGVIVDVRVTLLIDRAVFQFVLRKLRLADFYPKAEGTRIGVDRKVEVVV
jgi:hypothetical protein